MSKVLTMVRGKGGSFSLGPPRPPSVPGVHSGMVRERKTAQAARALGLLNTPFGRKPVPGRGPAFNPPAGTPKPDYGGWVRGYPHKPDIRSPGRLIGLTPGALAKTLGQAGVKIAFQMAKDNLLPYADPLGPLWFDLPGANPKLNFPVPGPDDRWAPFTEADIESECGALQGNETHYSVSWQSSGPPSLCGLTLQVPRGPIQDNFVEILEGGTTIYYGPEDPNFDDRMSYNYGIRFRSGLPYSYQWLPTVVSGGPPQRVLQDDPRARALPLRMLDPLTPPLLGGNYGFPWPVPWKNAGKMPGHYYPTPSTAPPVRNLPGIVLTPGGVRPIPPHVPTKPYPGEREIKKQVPKKWLPRLKKVQEGIFHPLTEFGDFLDALYEATPCAPKGLKSPADKLKAIVENAGCLDIPRALYNLAYNQAEDAVVGQGFKQLEKATKRLGMKGPYKIYQPSLKAPNVKL